MENNENIQYQREKWWFVWYKSDGLVRNAIFPYCSDEYFNFVNSLPRESIVWKRF